MFVPTGWQDWELVLTALLYAWAALAVVSLFAFGVAYGLFRTPHPAGTVRGNRADKSAQGGPGGRDQETITSTASSATVPPSESPMAHAVAQTTREWTVTG
jgi:hypothetical protein